MVKELWDSPIVKGKKNPRFYIAILLRNIDDELKINAVYKRVFGAKDISRAKEYYAFFIYDYLNFQDTFVTMESDRYPLSKLFLSRYFVLVTPYTGHMFTTELAIAIDNNEVLIIDATPGKTTLYNFFNYLKALSFGWVEALDSIYNLMKEIEEDKEEPYEAKWGKLKNRIEKKLKELGLLRDKSYTLEL